MQQLESLTREAESLAQDSSRGSMSTITFAKPGTLDVEAARQMQICNACRYCESFCAVFGAMTRRIEFHKADMHYLANLCHNCGACYHPCQYAAPHEFKVNVPQAMARVRGETYVEYAWPAVLGGLYRRNGLTLALATAFGLALFLWLAMRAAPSDATTGATSAATSGGNFYAILSHDVLATIFGVVFLFAAFALGVGVTRFCCAVSTGDVSLPAAAEATHDALRLKYLDGGHGDGCNEEGDRFTLARRRFHHLTFYGFMQCFASTLLATFYHYVLGRHAPYPLVSGPVVLGTIGGIGLLTGCSGLLWLNLRRDPARTAPEQRPMDRGFIALLMLISASGLVLLAWRDTAALATLLAVHLGAVLALFATLPYAKFAHGIFRSAALLKYAIEKRNPNTLGLGSE